MAGVPIWAPSTWDLSFWLAWKVTTRRAEIGISSPVFGLRPGRCGFSRHWKLPKPDSFTMSPFSSDRRISSKNDSTTSLASRLFRPTFSNSNSARSALVRVVMLVCLSGMAGKKSCQARANSILALSTQTGIALTKRGTDQFLHCILHILIRQCAFSILHNYPDSKAFLVFCDTFPAVVVEHVDRLHLRGGGLAQGGQQFAGRGVSVEHERQVAPHLREARQARMARQHAPAENLTIELEQDRHGGQVECLHQARMQRADPAD